MADTLTTQSVTPATIPSGSVIATDDAGASGHVQIVKLAQSADGSASAITADANGLEVQGAGTAGTPAGGVVSVQGVASGTALPVSASSLPLPSGASTLSEQQSQTTHLATIAGDTTDIETAVELLDDTVATTGSAIPTKGLAVSGTDGTNARVLKTNTSGELQVDVLSVAGTVAVTQSGTWDEVGINDSGNSITVDAPVGTPVFVRLSDGSAAISTIPVSLASVPSHAVTNAGTFAVQVDGSALTALQLLDNVVVVEDAAHSTGDSGVMPLAVRRDANTSLVGTDGDYAPLQVDAAGSLKVAITAGAGSGGTSLADDAAFTPASTSFTPIGGIVTSDAVDAGDGGAFAMLANRQQKVTLYDSGGSEVSVGGGTQYDEDTAHVSGDKVTMAGVVRADTAAAQSGTDGDRTVLITDSSGRLHVNVGNTVTVGSHAVTNAGTFAVQESGGALTALQIIDDWDESDRAKVNPIEGQAGVAAGAGAVGATVQRMTLASDDPAVAALQLLDNAVAGNELQVDVVAALPAGTNNVGDVDIETFEPSGDTTMQNAATATGNGTTLSVVGYGTAVVQVTGTFSATITFEGTADGTNWHAISATQIGAATIATTATTTGIYRLSVAGLSSIRARISSYSSGSVTAVGRTTNATYGPKVVAVSGTVTVGAHAVTNAGTFATQENGAALTALQVIDNPVVVDDAAFTPATTSVMMAGFEADETSTDSVDEGDAGAARMTLDRKVIVQPQPHTAGGLSIFRSLDLDETEEDVKTTPGQVYGVWFSNTATGTRWLKFYNATAANVTVGTTTPVITLALPGNSSDDISGVFSTTMGIAFDTAICVAATTGVADNDTGAPAANDVIVNVFYK